MTAAQRASVTRLLEHYRPWSAHHGDCVGADSEFHDLVREVASACQIVVHPPTNRAARAHRIGDDRRDPLPYRLRNQAIVDACDLLIAAPGEATEVIRSGTWATVRRARRARKPIAIVLPDGVVRVEGHL